nr:MAG TPA: hypothetical protein [Caudoviricetes sp.]
MLYLHYHIWLSLLMPLKSGIAPGLFFINEKG